MRNRTRVIAVAAVTAALAAGGTATALASPGGAGPSARATTVSVTMRCAPDGNLASLLGVPQARLDQALRAVKTSLAATGGNPAGDQFDAVLARYLGVSRARVRHALAAEKACAPGKSVSKPGGHKPAGGTSCPQPTDSKAGGPKAGGSKSPSPKSGAQLGHEALAAAVARQLHVSTAQVDAALAPVFAAGHADPSSPAFAAAARSLGVSTGQLSAALMQAKQSLAGCS